jgi:hypothetical protein
MTFGDILRNIFGAVGTLLAALFGWIPATFV